MSCSFPGDRFRHRPRLPLALLAALAVLILPPTPGRAADLNVTLPNVTGYPGSLVNVPIVASPGPAGLGILSIDFRLTLDPVVVNSSASLADGFLQFWGTPFVNATSGFVAAATAGASPIASSGTLLNTIQLRLQPRVPVGTVMPLAFQHLNINEGTPTVAVTNGQVQVIAPPLGTPPAGARSLALALESASPARVDAALRWSAPDGVRARLAIYAVDGRRVRSLAGTGGAGTARWDLRDDDGRRVSAGLYFVALTGGGAALVRRLVVAD
jgi:hypothetical protein